MPREIFGPHDYETYKQYMERLKQDGSLSSDKAAAMMTTSMLMKGRANQVVDRKAFDQVSKKLQSQTAFRQMMQDQKTPELLRRGSTTGLFGLMAEKENSRQKSFERYQRPKEFAPADAKFLDTAIKRLETQKPGDVTPEDKRRGPCYEEMMKRLREAKALTEEGKQLTGEQTKALVGAVKAYNDAGNEKPAPGKTEIMCVLSRYMPEKTFRSYCSDINKERGEKQPKEADYEDPENYPAGRLTGEAKTAKEWFAESRERLMKNFSIEGCAEAAALQKLSKSNPHRVVHQEELDREISHLVTPGSAFSRTLKDEKAREEYMHLAAMGESQELGSELLSAARKHSARAAQWQANQSIRALTSGPVNSYTAAENLANILAAREMAASGDAGEGITNSDFRARAERLRADPAFLRLAEHYNTDPSFRRQINRDLSADSSATTLKEAMKKSASRSVSAKRPGACRSRSPPRSSEPLPPIMPGQTGQTRMPRMPFLPYRRRERHPGHL